MSKQKISITSIFIFGLLSFIFISADSIVLWQKVVLVTACALIALTHSYRDSKSFTLTENDLVVDQMFSKKREYNLQSILSWNETKFHLFGISTGKTITLEIEKNNTIYLPSSNNAKEFEKVSDYLNTRHAELYQNNCR